VARDDLGRWVPGGNDISPPVSGGQPASTDEPPTPPDDEKVLRSPTGGYRDIEQT
jgi:hypothetical protein